MKEKPNHVVGPQIKGNRKIPQKIAFFGVLISFIAALQISTQYFAYSFNFQSTLGAHIGYVYVPWAIVVWYVKWGSQLGYYFFY